MDTLNLRGACRVCLELHNTMIPLDEQDESGLTINDKIKQSYFVGFLLSEPGWPNRLCLKCKADLDTAWRFRINLEAADACLKTYANVSIETFEEGVKAELEMQKMPEVARIVPKQSVIHIKQENLPPQQQPMRKFQVLEIRPVTPEPEEISEPPPPPQNVVCHRCGLMCKNSASLARHIRKHDVVAAKEANPENTCHICMKNYSSTRNLQAHMMIHSGEKPFSCNYCDKKFVRKADMVNHERTHTGEKPFGCKICGKRFALRHTLTTHIASHTGEKRHFCQICPKQFYQRDKLRVHLRTHGIGDPVPAKKRVRNQQKNIVPKFHPELSLGYQEVTVGPEGTPQDGESSSEDGYDQKYEYQVYEDAK